ncbi:MAG: AAA family ATPase [Candidatus Omnitrophica bacterium]|nr:AAA family ATPase [Candidatus Omnitrophota bacterium]
MYKDFYELSEYPFNVTSDPSFLFLSDVHKEALSHLLYGINNKKGFITITGEVGAGKTTLCKALLNKLNKNEVKTAYIFNPSLSGKQLLEAILEDFGITPEKGNKIVLFRQLNNFLLNELKLNHNVLLIIDEAQNMKKPLLEEIRMLSNLETEKEKLFQIILVGQPQLREKLTNPDLLQLKQRISVSFHLTPLTQNELPKYIAHRLTVAGSKKDIIFTNSCLDLIYKYTKGVPRTINLLCDRILLHGFVLNTWTIDIEMVQKSIEEIEGKLLEKIMM